MYSQWGNSINWQTSLGASFPAVPRKDGPVAVHIAIIDFLSPGQPGPVNDHRLSKLCVYYIDYCINNYTA